MARAYESVGGRVSVLQTRRKGKRGEGAPLPVQPTRSTARPKRVSRSTQKHQEGSHTVVDIVQGVLVLAPLGRFDGDEPIVRTCGFEGTSV